MMFFIVDNPVQELFFLSGLFANVLIVLKLYLCMFVTNSEGERAFSKLKYLIT